jgi:hypothetical protein
MFGRSLVYWGVYAFIHSFRLAACKKSYLTPSKWFAEGVSSSFSGFVSIFPICEVLFLILSKLNQPPRTFAVG